MPNCEDCICYEILCQHTLQDDELKPCKSFKNKADFVEVVRCKDCKHSINLDKNCALNRNAYKHCQLWRGEELTNIWHRYKKYYKDYSIVELDGFCDSGERK